MKTKLLSAVLLCLASFSASAGSFNCSGKLNYLGMNQVGVVYIGIENIATVHAICSTLTQGGFRVPTSVCKSMYATLLAARLSQAHVQTFYYDDPTTSSCAQITHWSEYTSFGMVVVLME